jgi:hypothetical protein
MEIFTNWFSDPLFMALELLVYIYIIYYILKEFMEIRLHWAAYRSLFRYLQNPFNSVDWAIIILQSVTVLIRVLFFYDRTRKNFSPFSDLSNVDPNLQSQQATKLQTLAFGYDLAFQIDSLLIMIMFFKFFKFFSLSDNLQMLWDTLIRAAKDISILIFMAILLFVGFSTMANNLFGPDMDTFSTLPKAFSSLLQVLIGVFDYEEMVLVDRVWCRLVREYPHITSLTSQNLPSHRHASHSAHVTLRTRHTTVLLNLRRFHVLCDAERVSGHSE